MNDFTVPFQAGECHQCSGTCGNDDSGFIDTVLVTIQVPVGFMPLASDKPGNPILEKGVLIGEDRSGEEVFEQLTLTVGQLVELFVAQLTSGDYVDTRRELFSIKAALQTPTT